VIMGQQNFTPRTAKKSANSPGNRMKPKSTASFLECKGDAGFEQFLITSKASDARRRGATTEAYGAIRRKEERAKATPPFDFAQGHEPVEWQMMP